MPAIAGATRSSHDQLRITSGQRRRRSGASRSRLYALHATTGHRQPTACVRPVHDGQKPSSAGVSPATRGA